MCWVLEIELWKREDSASSKGITESLLLITTLWKRSYVMVIYLFLFTSCKATVCCQVSVLQFQELTFDKQLSEGKTTKVQIVAQNKYVVWKCLTRMNDSFRVTALRQSLLSTEEAWVEVLLSYVALKAFPAWECLHTITGFWLKTIHFSEQP